jgi:hypothetical protein
MDLFSTGYILPAYQQEGTLNKTNRHQRNWKWKRDAPTMNERDETYLFD